MKYSGKSPVSFHMPGHKLGKDVNIPHDNNLYLMDVTEVPGLDNLHQPNGVIKEAQELAAKAFGLTTLSFGEWFHLWHTSCHYVFVQKRR